ncbi:hypothetical protein EUX98_g8839 [Antrodiella citrinella]|uniref:Uncharacterized protein n=1 Tax=Antrodiella citrinella TaxID=2447956 RepID=A0A4S4M4C0_9APHY|nr:hypothetical protein EUX98_g8839 [Antrodiella citrinella]
MFISLGETCNTPLLRNNKPIETFEYYPFFDWFGRLLALPGIVEHADRFCEAVSREPVAPAAKQNTWDGRIYRELPGHDGGLFIADRGGEGRWCFLLHGDFFNVEGNRIGGKHNSTGVMSMTCLNLPLGMRDDPAYTYVPGLIQGPYEPSAEEAHHSHFLRPLIDDLEAGYLRGIKCHMRHGDLNSGNLRTERVALAGVIMDLKAARPFAGLKDVNSHFFCFICKLWHRSHLGRTDYKKWGKADDTCLRAGSRMWQEAATVKDRTIVEHLYGTRYSELMRLSYFRPSMQLIVDPMHTFFLILQQRFFRDALQLENPRGANKKKRAPVRVAYYFDFVPPPAPSTLGAGGAEDLDDDEELEVEDPLTMLILKHISGDAQSLRLARASQLLDSLATYPALKKGITSIHQRLSESRPQAENLEMELKKRLSKHLWGALAYVCNDLSAFPEKTAEDLVMQRSLRYKDVTKLEMAEALVIWRRNSVEEDGPFEWPHFTPTVGESPETHMPRDTPSLQEHGSDVYRELTLEEMQLEHQNLRDSENMNYKATLGIGLTQRYLCELLQDDDRKATLAKKLTKQPLVALRFVCVDVNRLPSGTVDKAALVSQLVRWRMTQPLDPLPWADVDSPAVLDRIQQFVRDVIVPAWISKPPENVGLPKAGSLKADAWRTLFRIFLPLALLSLWSEISPLASEDAGLMSSVLKTSMYLTCAATVMMKRRLTLEDQAAFQEYLRHHVIGLKANFPGFILPSHHLAFHIADGMDLFGTVYNASCFGGERLIGRLQRIPTNHVTGEFEHTMLHSFCRSAAFRQWLLRPESPPLLNVCREVLDKAYNYSHTPAADENDDELPPLRGMPIEVDEETPARVSAPRGYYTIPSAPGKGNSFICFRPNGDPREEWVAAQIQRIYKRGVTTRFAVRRSRSLHLSDPDPFRLFWSEGFEAKMVSASWEKEEFVEEKWIVAHTARWLMNDEVAVVLSLEA